MFFKVILKSKKKIEIDCSDTNIVYFSPHIFHVYVPSFILIDGVVTELVTFFISFLPYVYVSSSSSVVSLSLLLFEQEHKKQYKYSRKRFMNSVFAILAFKCIR